MKSRCLNPNVPCYNRYGGRGINVVDRWLDFDNFYYDMFPGYSDMLQLDRVNNNSDYNSNNCRWVTPKENSRNTRRNRLVTYAGQTKCLSEWAEYLGVKKSTFSQRYYAYKWPLERLIGDYLG